jgi:hypothetical protein
VLVASAFFSFVLVATTFGLFAITLLHDFS